VSTTATDLPAGYRWATEDEMDRADAIAVRRTADSAGRPYDNEEFDMAVPTTVTEYVSGEWLIDRDGTPTHIYPVVGWGEEWNGAAVPVVTKETLFQMGRDFARIPDLDKWRMDGHRLVITSWQEDENDPVEESSVRPNADGTYTLDVGYMFWKVSDDQRTAMQARNYMTGC
jgi:hypothetical protein